MSLVYLLIAILVIMAMILLMSKRRALAKYAGYIALVAPVISSIYFLIQIPSVAKLQYLSTSIPWIKTLDINLDLRLDGLSLMFSLIISLIGIAVFFYATQYLSSRKDNLPRFYFYLTLFMFSMIGIVLSDNTILMYIFWELTSVSSFLLISYWYNNGDSQFGAMQSFMITVFGGLALLVGFIMLYIMTGTNNITEILGQADHIKNHGLFIPMIFMFLLGAFTKSAQFPFHIWLPRAMAAPTPVSAYLHSATMVKAGIFLLLRFTPLLGLSNMYIYRHVCWFNNNVIWFNHSFKTMGFKRNPSIFNNQSTRNDYGNGRYRWWICSTPTRRNSIYLCICIIWCAISSNESCHL